MGFEDLKAGDKVTRMLSGTIPMDMVVIKVEDDLIHASPSGQPLPDGGDWTFDVATGSEVDHELLWGPVYGVTGSVLVPPEKKAPKCGIINREQMQRKTCDEPQGHAGDHRDKDGSTWPNARTPTRDFEDSPVTT